MSQIYSSDVTDAVQCAIDQNLAPALSMSYGSCEPLWSDSDAQTMRTWAKRANAQGITWVASSGDGCRLVLSGMDELRGNTLSELKGESK